MAEYIVTRKSDGAEVYLYQADETISAMAHRRGWKRLERLINRLFCDDMHCAQAYVAEMAGTQNASIYRNKES